MLGSILDVHPNSIVANETSASSSFWRNLDRQSILNDIFVSSENNRRNGRISEGYDYSIKKQTSDTYSDILVMGDKIWNPATLLLHGDFGLLNRLEKLLGVSIKIIHSIRNPFDVIATMHFRSGAPMKDRFLWYFIHCDAVSAIRNRFNEFQYIDIHHELLIENPCGTIDKLCQFLDLECKVEYLDACKERLYDKPKKTRYNCIWDKELKESIFIKMTEYEFLKRYTFENYADLSVQEA
jgi:hypothetical protein